MWILNELTLLRRPQTHSTGCKEMRWGAWDAVRTERGPTGFPAWGQIQVGNGKTYRLSSKSNGTPSARHATQGGGFGKVRGSSGWDRRLNVSGVAVPAAWAVPTGLSQRAKAARGSAHGGPVFSRPGTACAESLPSPLVPFSLPRLPSPSSPSLLSLENI